MLRIDLLGPPLVVAGGEPVKVDTRKAIALLAYLALRDGPQARDVLAGLLWPDYGQDRARASLRRTLSALLKGLGPGEWVTADRATVALHGDDVEVDVLAFRDLLARARTAGEEERPALLSRAVELHRGDFLAGFSLRDSPDFDDWQFHTGEVLRRELAGALEQLSAIRSAHGEHDEAVAHAQRWLALDPLHEPAHRQLMVLYATGGRRAAALRQYRECVRVLHRELGVAPLEETNEVYRAVKEHRIAPAATPAPAPDVPPARPSRPAGRFRMVGREAELRQLLDAHADAGRGALAVVEGEPGIGKTRLVEELAREVERTGAPAVVVRCYEMEQLLAYAPVVAAVRAAVRTGDVSGSLGDVSPAVWEDVARLLPEVAARAGDAVGPGTADAHASQLRFLDALATVLLGGLSGARPALLAFDDAHWADEASMALLSYLARRLEGVLLVLVWRTEAVAPGHTLRRLARETPARAALTLDRLPSEAVDELVAEAVEEPADGLSDQLHAETEGVPLFVVHHLSALADGTHEGWHASQGVRDFLLQRIAAVDETGQQLLATAAVIGRSFDVDTLRVASGRSEEETVSGLEELLATGLVREQAGAAEPVYDFSHHKLRVEVLASTSLARRRLLHRRVAAALVERGAGRPQTAARLAQIAGHCQEAGDDEGAAEHFALAGAAARASYANGEAIASYQAAIALAHPDPSAMHEALGDLHTLAGAYDEAVTSYETAAALADDGRLAVLEHRLGGVRHRLGEWDLAEDHLETALRLLADEQPGRRARVLADASLTAHRRGDAERAGTLAVQARELAEEAGDERALTQADNLLGVLSTAAGAPREAIGHLERSLARAESRKDPAAQVAALNNLALAHRGCGDPETALPLAERARDLAIRIGDRHREAAVENNLADLLRASGRTDEAEQRVRRAVEILAELGGAESATDLRPEIWKLTEW
jgi:DNA-binding SARP family transcriptional activator